MAPVSLTASKSFTPDTLALSGGPSNEPIGMSSHELALLHRLKSVAHNSNHEAALLGALALWAGTRAEDDDNDNVC